MKTMKCSLLAVTAAAFALAAASAVAAPMFTNEWFDMNGRPTPDAQVIVGDAQLPKLLEGVQFRYPPKARDMGAAGCVTVDFTIRADGLTDRFVIVDSKPEGLFDDTVLTSLRLWKFEPSGKDVQAVLPLEFRLGAGTGSRLPTRGPSCARPHVELTGSNLEKASGPDPHYPPELARAHKQGCAIVAFKVQPDGIADDYAVYKAAPDESFVPAIIQALNGWKFEGVPAGKQGVVRFDFQLKSETTHPGCEWPKVHNYREKTS